MAKLKSDTYCTDIENILKHVNDDNFELATKAIETISKYAHELSTDKQGRQSGRTNGKQRGASRNQSVRIRSSSRNKGSDIRGCQ